MSLSVHQARSADDLRSFRELVLEYEDSLPTDLHHSNLPEQLANIGHGDTHTGFLAICDNAPGGCIALSRLDEQTAIVNRLFVRPIFRGRGIARALMDALTQTALERGYTRLVLDTDRDQLSAAYNLYLSLGFEVCEPYGPVDYATPTFMQRTI